MSKSRAKPHHLMLPNDFYADPGIRRLVAAAGEIAIGRYVFLRTRLNREGGIALRIDVESVGDLIGLSQPEWIKFIDLCIEKLVIQEEDEHLIWAELASNAEEMAERQRLWREKKRAQRSSGSVSTDSPKSVLGDSISVPETHKNRIEENRIEKNGIESAEPAEPNPPLQPINPADAGLYLFAEEALTPSNDPEVQRSNQFIGAGRRPMKKYPPIWLSPRELVDAIKIITEHGIPRERMDLVFGPAAARLKTNQAEGRDPSRSPAFTHLTTFCLTDALRMLKASRDLKGREQR